MSSKSIYEFPYPCPCCGSQNEVDYEGGYSICSVCGWEDDRYQRRYPDETGANGKLTLNQARKMWKNGETLKPWRPHPNRKG